MTGRITIDKLQGGETKTQEMTYLRECADVPANSYLASLLSEDLLEWFSQAIRGDLCCDVFELAQGYHRLSSEIAQLNREMRDMRGVHELEITRLKELQVSLVEVHEREIASFTETHDDHTEMLDGLRSQLMVAHTDNRALKIALFEAGVSYDDLPVHVKKEVDL